MSVVLLLAAKVGSCWLPGLNTPRGVLFGVRPDGPSPRRFMLQGLKAFADLWLPGEGDPQVLS